MIYVYIYITSSCVNDVASALLRSFRKKSEYEEQLLVGIQRGSRRIRGHQASVVDSGGVISSRGDGC